MKRDVTQVDILRASEKDARRISAASTGKACDPFWANERLATDCISEGGDLVAVMLLISIVLGLIPLAGIAWIVVSGTMTTVDGLFEVLIMLSLSGVFFLNAFWELRGKNKPAGPAKPGASSDES